MLTNADVCCMLTDVLILARLYYKTSNYLRLVGTKQLQNLKLVVLNG